MLAIHAHTWLVCISLLSVRERELVLLLSDVDARPRLECNSECVYNIGLAFLLQEVSARYYLYAFMSDCFETSIQPPYLPV